MKREGLPDLGHHRKRATGRRRYLDRHGDDPDTWHPASVLPPGLALVSTDAPTGNNKLAGTRATAGTFTFTMKVTDSTGSQATQQFTLTVQP